MIGSPRLLLTAARRLMREPVALCRNWYKSAISYSIAAAVLGVYVCDFQKITSKIPFYKEKYDETLPE